MAGPAPPVRPVPVRPVRPGRPGRLVLAALAAGCALAAAWPAPGRAGAAAAAPRPDRPLGVDTPGVLRQLLLDLPLEDARPAGAALEVRWVLSNDWSTPTTLTRGGRTVEVQLDEQADRLALALRLPWARLAGDGPLRSRLATTLEWRLTQRWGGYTDGPIEAWHEVGAYSRFQRPDHPRDAVALHLGEPGGATVAHLTGPRLSPGDLAVRTSLRLAEGERAAGPWAVALRLDLKVPLGRPADLGGSGGADAGVGLGGTLPLLPWLTLHAQAAARRVSPLAGGLPLRLRPWQLGAEASLVAWRGDWAVLLESRWLSALFERGWRVEADPVQGDALTPVARTQNQVSVGLRFRAVTAWLSEDWTPGSRREVDWTWFYDSNAPDLAVGLAVVTAF
jgi:hypothetical protein